MEVILDVKDTFCPQNQGTFLWKLDKQASKLSRQDEIKPLLSANYRINLDISVLTQWIFGYQDLPECSVITRFNPLLSGKIFFLMKLYKYSYDTKDFSRVLNRKRRGYLWMKSKP